MARGFGLDFALASALPFALGLALGLGFGLPSSTFFAESGVVEQSPWRDRLAAAAFLVCCFSEDSPWNSRDSLASYFHKSSTIVCMTAPWRFLLME